MSKCFPRRQLSDALGVRMGCSKTPFLLLRPAENKIYNQTPASGSISEES